MDCSVLLLHGLVGYRVWRYSQHSTFSESKVFCNRGIINSPPVLRVNSILWPHE